MGDSYTGTQVRVQVVLALWQAGAGLHGAAGSA